MNTFLCHYRVFMDAPACTQVVCCTCNRIATQAAAVTPFGVLLRLENKGWRLLDPQWYTLWQCPICQLEESRGNYAKASAHFGVMFPTAFDSRYYQGSRYARGRRKHEQDEATQGEQGLIPPRS